MHYLRITSWRLYQIYKLIKELYNKLLNLDNFRLKRKRFILNFRLKISFVNYGANDVKIFDIISTLFLRLNCTTHWSYLIFGMKWDSLSSFGQVSKISDVSVANSNHIPFKFWTKMIISSVIKLIKILRNLLFNDRHVNKIAIKRVVDLLKSLKYQVWTQWKMNADHDTF